MLLNIFLFLFILFLFTEGWLKNNIYIFLYGCICFILCRLGLNKLLLLCLSLSIYIRENRLSFIFVLIGIICIFFGYYSSLCCFILTEILNILIYLTATVI